MPGSGVIPMTSISPGPASANPSRIGGSPIRIGSASALAMLLIKTSSAEATGQGDSPSEKSGAGIVDEPSGRFASTMSTVAATAAAAAKPRTQGNRNRRLESTGVG